MDYVLLAGYLKLIPPQLVRAFKRRILNIHPGLLPSFGGKGMYGSKVSEGGQAGGSHWGKLFPWAAVPLSLVVVVCDRQRHVWQQGEQVRGRGMVGKWCLR